MLRVSTLLLLLLATFPLFAQWEHRFGARAGVAHYGAEGFRFEIHTSTPVFGIDYWLKRGRFGVDFGADAYQVKGAGNFFVGSADAQFLLGSLDGAHVGLGVGPNVISSEGDIDFNFVPSLWVHIPAGRYQGYVLLKRHTSSGNIDGDAETIMLMGGVRFGGR